jgi:hypothetical protein
MIRFHISGRSLMFVAKGKPWNVAIDHPRFGDIKRELELLRDGQSELSEDELIALADDTTTLAAASGGLLTFDEGVILVNGEPFDHPWVDIILTMRKEDAPAERITTLTKALNSLLRNPREEMRMGLAEYQIISRCGFLTTGELFNLKVVTNSFTDLLSDINHKPGAIVEWAKDRDDCPKIGATGYILLPSYPGYDFSAMDESRKLMLVGFWPEHAVGIHTGKLQVERYEVITELQPKLVNEIIEGKGFIVDREEFR